MGKKRHIELKADIYYDMNSAPENNELMDAKKTQKKDIEMYVMILTLLMKVKN